LSERLSIVTVAVVPTTADSRDVIALDVVDPSVDGRTQRRERNRAAMVDAMLALYEEGNLAPSSEEIAERAGLSPRSLFRHFDDIDDLVRASITRQLERVLPGVDIDAAPDATFPERVRALVDQRLRMFDAMGAMAIVARLREPFQPLVATQLRQARSFMRHQIERLFAEELARLDAAAAASVLAAADVLCSFEGYRLLRHDQRLTRARTAAVVADSLTRLLTPEARPS
jgi:AcrR family transcriptional regulator